MRKGWGIEGKGSMGYKGDSIRGIRGISYIGGGVRGEGEEYKRLEREKRVRIG